MHGSAMVVGSYITIRPARFSMRKLSRVIIGLAAVAVLGLDVRLVHFPRVVAE